MSNLIFFDVVYDAGNTIVAPHVDGVALTELVEQFERSSAYTDPAGGYGGLVIDYYQFGPLDSYFLGLNDLWANGKVPVLACQCGEVGCWPLMCKIEQAADAITWNEFEQPHRPKRNYMKFGPFSFARSQCRTALQSLTERI